MAPGERRKHRRVKAKNVAGHVQVKDEVLALALPIENISMGGLFVRCTDPLPVGTPVVMELVRGGDTLKVVGTTVAAYPDSTPGPNGPGMGIRFGPLPLEASQRLSRLLVDLASDRGAKAVPEMPSPTTITEEVQASRGAFDFGFVTLDGAADDDAFTMIPQSPAGLMARPAPQQAVPSWTSPAAPQSHATATPSVTHPSPAAHSSGTPASTPSILAPPAPSQSTGTAHPVASAQPRRGTLQPPQRVAVSRPAPNGESARLMVQVRGLLNDLGETQSELERRGREILDLRDELDRARADLERMRTDAAKKDARIADLERRLARGS